MDLHESFKKPLLNFIQELSMEDNVFGNEFASRYVKKILNSEWDDFFIWPLICIIKEQCEVDVKKIPFTHELREHIFKYKCDNFEKDYESITNKANSEIISLTDDEIPNYTHTEEIVLILGYYDILDSVRKLEIDESIQNNINNKYISRIVMFVECETASMVLANKMTANFKNADKLEIIPTHTRLTYKNALDYADRDNKENAVYLLTNSDCYFDSSVDLLTKLNFKNGKRVVSMTRKDRFETGEVLNSVKLFNDGYDENGNMIYKFGKPSLVNKKELGIMPPYSSDAWAFKSNIEFDSSLVDNELGRMSCEIFFQSRLHEQNIELFNIGFGGYIKCIHIHNSAIRTNHQQNMQSLSQEYIAPYTNDGKNIDWDNLTRFNFITGCYMGWHKNNFMFDNRYDGNFGKYVVRDIKFLFE